MATDPFSSQIARMVGTVRPKPKLAPAAGKLRMSMSREEVREPMGGGTPEMDEPVGASGPGTRPMAPPDASAVRKPLARMPQRVAPEPPGAGRLMEHVGYERHLAPLAQTTGQSTREPMRPMLQETVGHEIIKRPAPVDTVALKGRMDATVADHDAAMGEARAHERFLSDPQFDRALDHAEVDNRRLNAEGDTLDTARRGAIPARPMALSHQAPVATTARGRKPAAIDQR